MLHGATELALAKGMIGSSAGATMRLALLPLCLAGLPLCAQWDLRLELPRPTGQNLPQTLLSGTGKLVAGDFDTGRGFIPTRNRQILQVGPLLKLEGGLERSEEHT